MINKYFNIFYGNYGDAVLLIRKSDFTIVDVNAAALKLYDLPPEKKIEVIDKSFNLSDLSNLSQEDLGNILKEIKENGKWSTILPSKTLNNKPFLAETTVSLIELEGEEFLISRTEDVSNKIATKKDIIKAEKKFISILNKLPNGIIIHDKGEILYVNPYFLNSLQLSDSDFKGKNLLDVVDINYYKVVEEQISSIENELLPSIEQVKFCNYNDDLISFSIQSVEDVYNGRKVIISILSNLETQKILSRESIRANVAEDENVLLEKEIEKHKRTQSKLIKAQKLTDNVIDCSLDMIIASNNENKITHISPSALELFGYSKEEALSINPSKLYKSSDQFDGINKQLREKGSFEGEVENINKNGEVFYSYLSASKMLNSQGEIVGTMGVSRDIRKIKRIEKEIIDSENRYLDLFENLSDAIVILDENSLIIDINQAGMDLFEIESIKNNKISDFVIDEHKELLKKKRKEYVKTGKIEKLELEVISKKGNNKQVEISSNAIFKDGIFKGSRDIIRDVSESKKKEKLLHQQTSKIESVFQNSRNVVIWTLDKDFKVSSVNNEFLRVFEEKFGESVIIGTNFIELIKKSSNTKLYTALDEIYDKAQKGQSQEFESVLLDKNGEKIWFETFLSPIKADGKEKCELACLAIDITRKKLAEYQLIASLEEKEILLKEVHHRVKNNLQVISSILNLQSSYVKDENTLTILKESQNRIKSMSFIHESLYRTADFSFVNLSEYIENLTRNLIQSYLLDQGNIKVNLDLGNYKLNMDQAIPCGLIINELVSNSMKYAFPSNTNGEIFIKLTEKDNNFTFIVGDNGIGLPENINIEDTDSLGLQLVYTLIDQLDGKIEVINGIGTKYLINFTRIS